MMIPLFFIGIIEMLIVTSWTKMVAKTKIFASGGITMINVLIWYYVLRIIVDDINNWRVVLVYALGCSLGTVISTFFFHLKEKGPVELKQSHDPRRTFSE